MSRNGKVIVAMSGGVDSSVAASMLRDEGYECVGVFLRVGAHQPEDAECALQATKRRSDGATEGSEEGAQGRTAFRDGGLARTQQPRRLKHGCCSATDAIDARAISGKLGMPFYALNFERDFDRIINYFVDEYARARTPNPCVMCNIHVKFGKLLRYADMMDAEFIATGHYARVLHAAGGIAQGAGRGRGTAVSAVLSPSENHGRHGRATQAAHTLCRSLNEAKDQSYVLFGIRRDDLPRCLFPLGEMTDKATVRRIAADLGLRVHDKPDSQEICFVPNNDYKQLVHERLPQTLQSGSVIDADGKVLGEHDGISGFTIGQRRGLGIATGSPIYVTKLNVLDNTVTVGPQDDLLSTTLVATDMNWLVDWPDEAIRGQIKIRHMHPAAAGTFRRVDDRTVEACFDEPQLSVTPGQAAVFYRGDVVWGGGWIGEKCE